MREARVLFPPRAGERGAGGPRKMLPCEVAQAEVQRRERGALWGGKLAFLWAR